MVTLHDNNMHTIAVASRSGDNFLSFALHEIKL
jgi:hypothetical protein